MQWIEQHAAGRGRQREWSRQMDLDHHSRTIDTPDISGPSLGR